MSHRVRARSLLLVPAALAASAALTIPTAAQVSPTTATEGGRRIVVMIEQLRSDRGRVMGGLYADPGTWLVADHATADCRAPIRGGRARCVFEGVPAGPVAFAGMHDEDGDGQLDRDLIGLPSEGYAFSNDAREPFGPPSFRAASFSSDVVRVRARYGI